MTRWIDDADTHRFDAQRLTDRADYRAVAHFTLVPADAVDMSLVTHAGSGTATDNAGNSGTASINISVDRTAPNIGYAIAPPPNANGWYTGDVNVTFTCSDALSGIDICPGVLKPAGDGVGITVRGTASDRAGNSAVSVAQLNVDRAPPSVVIQSPASGSVVNAASVQVSGTVADATSGVASVACNNGPAVVSGSTFSCNVALHEGANTINVTAVDRAGLMSTAGISVFMTPAAVAHVSVEQPPTGSTLTTPFQVWGWAIDPRATTGTGVDQVNVWAVRKGSASAQAAAPVLLGTATYGLDRPDIRRTLGDRFGPSGYAFTVRGLAPGDYMLQVSARSTVTGAFDNVSTTWVKIPRASGGDDGGDAPDIGVSYNAHVQDSGWQGYVSDNAIAGTTGQSKRMEAIKIKLYNAGSGVRICYQAHVQNQGWQGKVCDDQLAGTEGQSLRMEALTVELQGAPGNGATSPSDHAFVQLVPERALTDKGGIVGLALGGHDNPDCPYCLSGSGVGWDYSLTHSFVIAGQLTGVVIPEPSRTMALIFGLVILVCFRKSYPGSGMSY
jgi:hypothetical protein